MPFYYKIWKTVCNYFCISENDHTHYVTGLQPCCSYEACCRPQAPYQAHNSAQSTLGWLPRTGCKGNQGPPILFSMSFVPGWARQGLESKARCRDQNTSRNPVFLDKITNRKGPAEPVERGEDKKEETRQERPGLKVLHCAQAHNRNGT